MRPILILILLLAAIPVLAEDCRYGHRELTKIDSDRYSEHVRDFLENDRYGEDWACLMKNRNIKRDTLKNCLPHEEEVFNFVPEKKVLIEGKIRYMGMIPQKYSYDLSPEGIEVRIAFTGELGNDEKALSETAEKLKFASELWTKNSPTKIPFHFRLVKLDENPHFTPKLVTKAPGTKYNSLWAIDDSKVIVAHEVGHMLGLDDEYSVVRSMVWQVKNNVDTRMCNVRSLMCDYYTPNAKLYPYIYYQILRRAYCLRNQ